MIESRFAELLLELDQQIEGFLDKDETAFGRFTRAYVHVTFDVLMRDESDPWMALGVSTVIDPRLQQLYQDWFVERLQRHIATDDDVGLEMVRFAVDGAWLAFMCQTSEAILPHSDRLRDHLLAQTFKAPVGGAPGVRS